MKTENVYQELEKGVIEALKTYSNVHRGSGHYSQVTTRLFEQARGILLEFLGLDNNSHTVVFGNPRSSVILAGQLKTKKFKLLNSNDFGLPFGVSALVVRKEDLPKQPVLSGGGSARLVSPGWIIWSGKPERFEAGTPAIINIIAFAKSILLIQKYGESVFKDCACDETTVEQILYQDDLHGVTGNDLIDKLQELVVGGKNQVPTLNGDRPFINFDNAASTPTFFPVWDAVRRTWQAGRKIQEGVICEVRGICHQFLNSNAQSYDVIFTSNTTDAVNIAAESLIREIQENEEPVILSTLLEHSSNDLPWRKVSPHRQIRLKVDREGFFDLNELEGMLEAYNNKGQFGKCRIKLVVVSGASNVLGSCNDLKETVRIAHKYGARVFVDAAQLAAHHRIEMESGDMDYLAFSAHKIYAPFGTGVLAVKKGVLWYSPSELEEISASGEANPGGIAGLGKALLLLMRTGFGPIREQELQITQKITEGLLKIKGIKLHGADRSGNYNLGRKVGVLTFDIKGMLPDKIAGELAFRSGIGSRYGCHCAHILIKDMMGVGPVLAKFQGVIVSLFPKLQLPGVVRISVGLENTAEEADCLLDAIRGIASGKNKMENSRIDRTAAKTLIERYSEKCFMGVYSRAGETFI